MFCMLDSQGRNGGCSDIEVARLSNDESCLGGSPSSTSGSSASTASAGRPTSGQNSPTGSGANSAQPTDDSSSGDVALGVGVIAGLAVGIAAVIVLGALLCFLFVRRRRRRNQRPKAVDLTYEPVSTHTPPHFPPEEYQVTQFVMPMSATTPSRISKVSAPSLDRLSSGPSRVVVHTDISEAPPSSDEIVELPPQYSSNRTPLAGMMATPTNQQPKRRNVNLS